MGATPKCGGCTCRLHVLALTTERQSARMSKIKNGGLDQYDDEPFEEQQFGTDGVEELRKYIKVISQSQGHSSNYTSVIKYTDLRVFHVGMQGDLVD